MASGVLAYESEKRAAKAALFLLDAFHARRAEQIVSSKLHILRAVFLGEALPCQTNNAVGGERTGCVER
jgi:hypothetical protein